MVQFKPLNIEEYREQKGVGRSISAERLEAVVGKFTTQTAVEKFAKDYAELSQPELVAKYPKVFLTPESPSRTRAEVYGILDYFEIPRKRPKVANGMKKARSSAITPQALERAFKPGAVVSPDAGMQALANALLPLIRNQILDDLVTALTIVKQARS